MASIDELLIRLDSTSASLQRELRRADQAIGQSATNVERQAKRMDGALAGLDRGFGRINGLLATFGAALGVNFLASATKEALNLAGGLGELGQQLGVSTDALQVYQYAATQAGLSNAEVETSLIRLGRTLGEAAQGEKTAGEAFTRLGISIRDQSGILKTNESILGEVADAIARLPDPAARAAAANDLFGRSGQRLLPILEQGAEGMAMYEERARSLGLVLSEEQIAAADKAADKWAEFDATLSKLWQGVVSDVAPAFSQLFDTLMQPEVLATIRAGFESVAFVVETVVQAINATIVVLHGMGAAASDLIAGLDDLTGGFFGLTDAADASAGSIDGLASAEAALDLVLSNVAGTSEDAARASIARAEAAAAQGEAALAAAASEIALGRAMREAGGVMGMFASPAMEEVEEAERRVEVLREGIERARALLAGGGFGTAGGGGGGGGGGAAGSATDAYEKLIASLQEEVLLMERELDLLGLSTTERDAAVKLMQAEAQLRRAGRSLSEEEQEDLERLIGLWGVLRDERLAADRAVAATAYLDTLEDELAALGNTARQTAVLADLRAAGYEVTDAAVDAEGRLTEALDGTAAAIARVSGEKFDRAALIADIKRFDGEVKSAAQEISADITEGIYLGFTDGLDSVSDFLDTWLDRIALQILERQFVLPITTALVGSMPGLFGIAGPTSAGPGGVSSAWTSELSGLFGDISSTFDDVFAGLTDFLGVTREATASAVEMAGMGMDPSLMGMPVGGSAGFGLGDAFGAAGTGLAIGSLLGAITGNTGMGSSLGGSAGGLVGAAIGSVIPGVGTLLGSIIGSVGGGLLGGLFGGGESVGPISVAEIRNPLGDLELGMVNADNGGASAREFGNSIIELLERSVGAIGGEIGTGRVLTDVGNLQDGGGIYVNPTGNLGNLESAAEFFGDDAEAAALAAARYIALQAGVEGVAQEMVDALDRAFATSDSADDLEARLAVINLAYGEQAEELGVYAQAVKAVNDTIDEAITLAEDLGIAESLLNDRRREDLDLLADDFVTGLTDAILQATDPEAFALLELERWRDEQLAEAEAVGRGLAEIEELYGIRREQIAEQYAQAASNTLRDLLDEINRGDAAGLSPRDQFIADQAAYNQALQAAQTDGATADEQTALAAAVRDLLGTAQDFYSFTPDYFALKDQIEAAIEAVIADLPGFARGTRSAPGGFAIVGEEGPELVNLPQGAQVIPHPETERILAMAQEGFDALSPEMQERVARIVGIPGFENGTMDAPGGLSLVGEAGRELVLPADGLMPALPAIDFGGGDRGWARGGGQADMSGVEQRLDRQIVETRAVGREVVRLTERVARLEAAQRDAGSQMQKVAAGVGRTLAQPAGTAGPRRRGAA